MITLQLSKRLFNDTYYPYLLDYSNRYEVWYGGAGSGKSFFIAQKLLVKALTDKRKVLVLRKVGRTVKQSVFQLLIDTLLDWKILANCKVNRTDFTIELPNGSSFICSGLDDPEKIKSITGLTDAWMEEATEFYQEDFNQIDLRIRHQTAKNQQVFLSFNPVSKVNWNFSYWFQQEQENTFVMKTTYKDNSHLPQEYINSLLRLEKTNPTYYKIYALGEFGSLDKLVFNNWTVENFDYSTINGDLLCGLDFGFSIDSTAFICSIMAGDKIYVFNEVFRKGLLNNQIAKIITDLGFSKSVIIADSSELKSIEEIRQAGVRRIKPAVKGQGSVLQGIQKLQQYEIVVHPSCVNLIEELGNYSWTKDKSGEYINTPVDRWNHGIDALRYSLQCVQGQIKLMNKSVFDL